MYKIIIFMIFVKQVIPYDPEDKMLKMILLPKDEFEAFYQKGIQSEQENSVRPAHLHGSFNAHRNPALIGVPNSAAYGFRFDGKRRFNYD
ncbi:hypothetical protein HCN44_001281 [Aphidius gifuensis]|uniref:Uncharacterized protein n=1 Tax=Aphidius gifuensis TaxID=684658 RepID=A0A834XK51_APHGI|nr:uncharacterized protein LOC122857011 [Aphidius gifuensis]KAF7988708.1 hypothetical protein HCN44_001281 [Aphidius gifuensis]